jgi:hypothetical protein
MIQTRALPLLASLGLAALPLSATTLTLQIQNLGPMEGTWVTPVWVGFHDGGFDSFDTGMPASMAVERYAEDGSGSYLAGDFSSYGGAQVQATLVADSGIPPIAPGGTATLQLEVDGSQPSGRYLSFLAMVLPSNDAFVANDDPMSLPVFDGSGAFMGLDVVIGGNQVFDAGTEINDEIPAHTAFLGQMTPDTGVSENGVIAPHGGFNPMGSGGILDDPMFAMADFAQPGYPLMRITVTRESAAAAEDTPAGFTLSPAYPNPFNPSTTLNFSLASTAPVSLSVYNLMGARVATLVDGLVGAGEHAVTFDASGLASGLYLAVLESGGHTRTSRLVLLK